MMTNLPGPLKFTVPLSSSAHRLAKQFYRQQSEQKKAKQVYLNTLAVSAVKFYLRCMGIEANWEASWSWNPIMQTLIDVADLEIPKLGKLECRPVLLQEQVIRIPPEVGLDRIGYLAVRLDQSLQEATLLGFVNTVPESGELEVNQLRSLADLLEHLHQIRASTVKLQVNLRQWFENIFADGWQSLEALLATDQKNLAFGFRGDSPLGEASVKGAKLINLGLQLESQSVALLVAIASEAEQKVDIIVQVHPVGEATYLPLGLKLSLLSESKETLQTVQSRSQDDYIQLKRFWGSPGEGFSIQVTFGEASVTENFII
jgi:hypothetical protein